MSEHTTPPARHGLLRRWSGRLLTVSLLAVLAWQVATVWWPQWRGAQRAEGRAVGALTVQTRDGRKVPLSQYAGRPLVLSFWATWCLPCRAEMPLLADAYPVLRKRGITLLGVNLAEPWPQVDAYVADLAIPYPVVRDPGTLAATLNVDVIPTTVVVGADGRVRDVLFGFRPWVAWQLKGLE